MPNDHVAREDDDDDDDVQRPRKRLATESRARVPRIGHSDPSHAQLDDVPPGIPPPKVHVSLAKLASLSTVSTRRRTIASFADIEKHTWDVWGMYEDKENVDPRWLQDALRRSRGMSPGVKGKFPATGTGTRTGVKDSSDCNGTRSQRDATDRPESGRCADDGPDRCGSSVEFASRFGCRGRHRCDEAAAVVAHCRSGFTAAFARHARH
ncbi:hypothetical protein GGF32_005863 [Allomyces javanicus]|nr:hypothetical protein GGF32_005863 [Allomyces javanicus]